MDHASTGEERLGAEERGLPHSAIGLGPAPVRYSKFCQMPWLNFGRCGIAFSVAPRSPHRPPAPVSGKPAALSRLWWIKECWFPKALARPYASRSPQRWLRDGCPGYFRRKLRRYFDRMALSLPTVSLRHAPTGNRRRAPRPLSGNSNLPRTRSSNRASAHGRSSHEPPAVPKMCQKCRSSSPKGFCAERKQNP